MSQPRIFVQIASYRDPECQWTIRDLFARAACPDRVFVGVCWQYVAEEDADCFQVTTRPDQVRCLEFDAGESRGVGWARHHAQSLWRGEDYVLQIDSHMRFVDDWDSKMIDMLARCPSLKPVLTTYPPGYKPPDIRHGDKAAKLSCQKFHDNGIAALAGGGTEQTALAEAPSPSAFCAAGFIFAPAQVFEEVPYDPHIYFLGEEISLSARLWTSGWDLFAPNRVLLYHYYGMRDKARRHSAKVEKRRNLDRLSLARVRHLLGIETTRDPAVVAELETYGLGGQRPLRDYEDFSGLSFRSLTVARYAKSWPFHLTASARAARESALERPELADSAQAFVLGDDGVIFSEPAQEIFHLNSAAMFLWCSLEAGDSRESMVGALGDSLRVPRDRAEALLTETLRHWWDIGLLASSLPVNRAAVAALRRGPPAAWNLDLENFPGDATPRAVRERTYRLLDATVRVVFETPEQERWVHPVAAHLEAETADGEADALVSIIERSGEHYIYLDGEPSNHCRDPSALAPLVKGLILQAGINRHSYFMCIHAGVVTDGRSCLLLPGEPGKGKSTLTAALVKSGYRYGSDEIALLSSEGFRATPVPVAMSVKASGFEDMAELHPETAALPVHSREDGMRVRYFLPPGARRDGAGSGPLPVQRIVFPNYDPDKPSGLSAVDKAEALRILLSECLAIPADLDRLDVAQLVRWIRTLDCYRLTLSSVEDALAIGVRMLEGTEPLPGEGGGRPRSNAHDDAGRQPRL